MANRMVKKQSTREYGSKGEATIVKLDSGKVRINFIGDNSEVVLVPKQGDVFDDKSDANFPEYVPLKKMKVDDKKHVRLTMDKGNNKVLFINPFNGEYTVKFSGFQSADKDTPPTMTTLQKTGNNGKSFDSVEFYPFLEIVQGAWKGAKLRSTFYDKFGKDEENGTSLLYGTGKWTEQLKDFLDCIGVDLESIEFSENLLPEIQRIALENDREFQVNLFKGYIANYIQPLGSDDYLEDDFTEEKDEVHPALADE